jgi:hypothetical protein
MHSSTEPRLTLRHHLHRAGSATLVVAAICGIGLTGVSLANAGTAQADRVAVNEQLNSGERITSPDGRYTLELQSDGNLVEYGPGHVAVWATGTSPGGGTIARLQGDGNLVVIAPGNRPVWASNTAGTQGATLELQNDANLVLYGTGHIAAWASSGIKPSNTAGDAAVAAAKSYLGRPYQYGGGHGPTPGGTPNVDCSGLVRYAYYIATGRDVLNGTTTTQAKLSDVIAASAARPGDLIFYSGNSHVAIYLGNGQMIEAPHTGANVRIVSIRAGGTYRHPRI